METIVLGYNHLNKEMLMQALNKFSNIKHLNVDTVIKESKVVFSKEYDFLLKNISVTILEYDGEYLVLNKIDGARTLEPLFIQVDEFGYLMDDFFYDFIVNNPNDLSKYAILYTDYATLMEDVRLESGFVEVYDVM